MDGEAPKILLRNRDDKYWASFDRMAARAPNMNATAQRFVGSVRRKMIDHMIVLDDRHPGGLVGEHQQYDNEPRPR